MTASKLFSCRCRTLGVFLAGKSSLHRNGSQSESLLQAPRRVSNGETTVCQSGFIRSNAALLERKARVETAVQPTRENARFVLARECQRCKLVFAREPSEITAM